MRGSAGWKATLVGAIWLAVALPTLAQIRIDRVKPPTGIESSRAGDRGGYGPIGGVS